MHRAMRSDPRWAAFHKTIIIETLKRQAGTLANPTSHRSKVLSMLVLYSAAMTKVFEGSTSIAWPLSWQTAAWTYLTASRPPLSIADQHIRHFAK